MGLGHVGSEHTEGRWRVTQLEEKPCDHCRTCHCPTTWAQNEIDRLQHKLDCAIAEQGDLVKEHEVHMKQFANLDRLAERALDLDMRIKLARKGAAAPVAYDDLENLLDDMFGAAPDKVKFVGWIRGWAANYCAGCAASLDGGNKPWRCTCGAAQEVPVPGPARTAVEVLADPPKLFEEGGITPDPTSQKP